MTVNGPQTKSIDVLGLGAVAVDDLLYVERYPAADSKVRVLHRERQGGGQTGTALVAAARLGAKCAYGGRLGECELSRYVRDTLTSEGVDCSRACESPNAAPAHSTIIVDESGGTRTILSSVVDGGIGPSDDGPPENLVAASRVLLVDHHGLSGTRIAVDLAVRMEVPVVADFERRPSEALDPIMAEVDHLIVSQRFAAEISGEPYPERAVERLWSDRRRVVIVTCGARGGFYRGVGTPVTRYDAPDVAAIDTTGCGDIFHGAYAAGLAFDAPLPDRIRIAALAAAIKATRRGGQGAAPTREEVSQWDGPL